MRTRLNELLLARGQNENNKSNKYKSYAGLFFMDADEVEDLVDSEGNLENYGKVHYYELDDDANLYHGTNSVEYVHAHCPDAKCDTIVRHMISDADDVDEECKKDLLHRCTLENIENWCWDDYMGETWIAIFQYLAYRDLLLQDYDGAHWEEEDLQYPDQYQIWNLKCVHQVYPNGMTESLLTEGKNIERTWEQYKDRIIALMHEISPFTADFPEETFKNEWCNRILTQDPTYTKGSSTTGDYGVWLTNMWLQTGTLIAGTDNVLKEFIKKKTYMPKKDINQYKSISELSDAVEHAEMSDRQKERMLRNSKDIKLVYSDNYWKIYEPLSFAGSCTLGKGTDWCTAHSDVPEHYEHYTSDGDTLLVIVDADNPNIKYQYSTKLGEFKNTDDLDEDLESVFMHHPKVIDFIKTNYPAGGEELEKILADAFHTSPYEMRTALDNGEIYKIPNATNPEEVGKFLVDNEYVEDFFGDEEWWQYKPDGSVDWESMMDDDDGQWAFASNGNAYQWAI